MARGSWDCTGWQVGRLVLVCTSGLKRAKNSSRKVKAMMEGVGCENDTDRAGLAVLYLGSTLYIDF
ncbi:hypothetical protein BY996DRAFT_6473964 [Phakopsora pachyrhizi]|nr:hypothetical protein BY996DRAFT_6473964 [Phakopsora pachyrhizi]